MPYFLKGGGSIQDFRYYKYVNQPVTGLSWTDVSFPAESYRTGYDIQIDSIADTQFNITRSGNYLISVHLPIYTPILGTYNFHVRMFLNGGVVFVNSKSFAPPVDPDLQTQFIGFTEPFKIFATPSSKAFINIQFRHSMIGEIIEVLGGVNNSYIKIFLLDNISA